MKENAVYVQKSELVIHEKPKILEKDTVILSHVNEWFGPCRKEMPVVVVAVAEEGRIG